MLSQEQAVCVCVCVTGNCKHRVQILFFLQSELYFEILAWGGGGGGAVYHSMVYVDVYVVMFGGGWRWGFVFLCF